MSVQKKLINILFFVSSIIFIALCFIIFIFFYYGRSLPSEITLLNYTPPTTTRIFSSTKQLMEEYAVERRIIVRFEDIPDIIKAAFLIAEDKAFYHHSGLSFQSLARAIAENTTRKSWKTKPAGGSTITQQVAKNLLVGNERSITRKIKEAIMAFRIESSISKNKILEIYLNHLYLGKGCYGIFEACNYYFAKNLNEITPEEAAFIAALPSAPSIYTNMKDNSKILLKRNSILSQMYELGFIDKDQLINALSTPIITKMHKTKLIAPYFSEEVHKIFTRYISHNEFFRGGYNVVTTMNETIQIMAQKCLEDGLIDYEKKQTWDGPLKSNDLKMAAKQLPRTINKIIPVSVKEISQHSIVTEDSKGNKYYITTKAPLKIKDSILIREIKSNKYELYQQPKATGGIIVMDADTGDILAMSGGYSFDISSFNCVTQAYRQPGSAVKPFVYAAALESGMDEYDEIDDRAVTIKIGRNEYYSPKNYSKKTYGKMPMRNGLIYSRNLATINLAQKIGYKPIRNMLGKLQLSDSKFNISYVLGAKETTLLKLVSAFSSIVNKGNMIIPRFIKEVSQQTASNIPFKNQICNKKIIKNVMSAETAMSIKNMLRDTAKYGTANLLAKVAQEYNIDVGGKTGTTNDFKDAWFIGYISKGRQTLIIGVFIGYEIPKSLGEHSSGAKIALPIFYNFVKELCKN